MRHHNLFLRSASNCLSAAFKLPKTIVQASAIFIGVLGLAATAAAQDFSDLQTPKGALVLKEQGSFFVGGDSVEQTATEIGFTFGGGAPGHLTINQMYVEYMIPKGGGGKVPVVMLHGATLSGKTYETTPDGRMGWDEYFVRQGHPVYVPDQVSRARSGFNQAIYNNVQAGVTTPASAQPIIFRISDELAWTLFRFGSTCCTAYADEQFPTDDANKFSKQGIPDLNATLPTPNPTYKALSDLAIQVKGAVLMGHSESGLFPLEAALTDPAGIRGLIDIEPGGCNAAVYTDEQVATLATIPILVVFGDHLDTNIPGFGPFWEGAFADCQAFITRVNDMGGNAQMLYPPDLGIYGNSHMIMQDENNLQIADLILDWIRENVGTVKTASK
jgi:pimeloyl-ACP methyl ester carboxylesterase